MLDLEVPLAFKDFNIKIHAIYTILTMKLDGPRTKKTPPFFF